MDVIVIDNIDDIDGDDGTDIEVQIVKSVQMSDYYSGSSRSVQTDRVQTEGIMSTISKQYK